MMSERKDDRRRRSTTAFIAVILVLHGIACFKLSCPPQSIPALARLRIACGSTAWPFLSYNMYAGAHYEGDFVSRDHVFGTFIDGSRRELTAEDFEIEPWRFRTELRGTLYNQHRGSAHYFAERLYQKSGEQLTQLDIETVHYTVSRNDVVAGKAKVHSPMTITPDARR